MKQVQVNFSLNLVFQTVYPSKVPGIESVESPICLYLTDFISMSAYHS